MGLLDSLAARLGYSKAKAYSYPAPLLAQAEGARYSIPDGSAQQTQINLYTQLDWISAAIEHVANIAAGAVFSVEQLVGEESKDIPNHPFEILLRAPNPLQTGMELWRDFYSWRLLTGNAYLYSNRASETAPPAELWVLPSNRVKPVPDGKMYLRGYVFTADSGAPIALETWQVSHCKSFNPLTPFAGMSAVQSLAYVALGDIAQQKYNANLFGKDNAKVPGALAFSDFIGDTEWEKIKEDTRRDWGGSQRGGPMFLRGVGSGGVNWVSMALTQKEMEFLESRKFTKEEIFTRLAPGLASIVDVTATEANATTGRATLIDLAVWPLLNQAAGRITADILPAYGDGLICEPDDIRVTNRVLELQEQSEYSKTHTIDEVRFEYYGDAKIGDNRGVLLPAQIATFAGALQQQALPSTSVSEAGAGAGVSTSATDVSAEAQAEMKAWERFAIKRLGKGGRDFEPRAIPVWDAARIRSALKMAATPEQVRAAFGEADVNATQIMALKASIDAARDALAHEAPASETHIHLPETMKADFSAALPVPVINVAAPNVVVNVPEFPAFPAIPAPVVNVAAPNVSVAAPSVTVPVTVQPAPESEGRRDTKIKFQVDARGDIIGATAVSTGE